MVLLFLRTSVLSSANTVRMKLIMCTKLPCAPNNLVVIMQNLQEKANLQKTKVNATKIRKVRVDEYKLRTGKEWRP